MSTPYIEPPPAPRHQCINANCGCNDLVSAGPCTEWCAAHGVELGDIERGKARVEPCECGHAVCNEQMPARRGGVPGTPERGAA